MWLAPMAATATANSQPPSISSIRFSAKAARNKGFGAVGQIDLEKLRALQPDLIVATEMDSGKAAQLSTVAPVYLQKASAGKAYGFSVEEDLAGLVGRSDVFAERRKTYDTRLAAVKRR